MASISDTSNDTRGWVLCVLSAVACVAGACIVCVDIFIRLIPGKKNFNIQDSDAFLSSSMSLSFGVMIFSSLFSMLPSSKRYLIRDGNSDQMAGLLMMGSFAVGFLGMQVVSRIIHQLMPSHVVDCDHSHEDEAEPLDGEAHTHVHDHVGVRTRPHSPNAHASETTPLLIATGGPADTRRHSTAKKARSVRSARSDGAPASASLTVHDRPLDHRTLHSKRSLPNNRPSMVEIQNRVLSFVKDVKSNCDESGPCFGYTDPCGQECKRTFALRTPSALQTTVPAGAVVLHAEWEIDIPVVPEEIGSCNGSAAAGTDTDTAGTRDHEEMHEDDLEATCPPSGGESSTNVSNYHGSVKDGPSHGHGHNHCQGHSQGHAHDHDHDHDLEGAHEHIQHHHHVPANAFLSIGLQTVLAIGLHKFPEGFITFATNHANPALGLNVFMALFVHNIAEGFAMALPLYMALGSRLKAILWSAALGGLSQPVGAGCAALWLAYMGRSGGDSGKGDSDDLGTAYGVLFAVTAGIMVAVALQLFVESLTLHHNRQLTIGFAFVGMLMLGLSNAIGSH